MEHLEELTKVGVINITAFVISLSDVENFLRIGGLAVAFIYTCLKIVQLIKNWNKNGQ